MAQWEYMLELAWNAQPWIAFLAQPLSLYSFFIACVIFVNPEVKPDFEDTRSWDDSSL